MAKTREWPPIRLRRRPGMKDDYCIDCGIIGGRRVVYFRRDLRDAKALALQCRERQDRLGELGFNLSPKQIVDAAEAYEIIQPAGFLSLVEAARFFVEAKTKTASAATAAGTTVDRLFEMFMEHMGQANLRPRAVESAMYRLTPFIRHFKGRELHSLSVEEVQTWFNRARAGMAPGTRLNDIRAIGQLFTFAKTRGISDFNPVIGMTRPKLDTRMPVAMPVQDVKRLLEYVEKKIPWHSHQFALGFFAGVRPAELSRMTWANVNLAERLITIGPEIAKTRRVRHIAIEPNLAAWLTVPRESPDLILPRFNPERRIICEELKLEWPPDVMRHSFATYHVARYEDPGRTAYQLGHTNGVHVLYDHYRGLATKAEAEEYWKIVP